MIEVLKSTTNRTITLPLQSVPKEVPQDPSVLPSKHPDIKAKRINKNQLN
jgi:hypothetical protein